MYGFLDDLEDDHLDEVEDDLVVVLVEVVDDLEDEEQEIKHRLLVDNKIHSRFFDLPHQLHHFPYEEKNPLHRREGLGEGKYSTSLFHTYHNGAKIMSSQI